MHFIKVSEIEFASFKQYISQCASPPDREVWDMVPDPKAKVFIT